MNYSVTHLKSAGYLLWELKVLYSLKELKQGGFTAEELKATGYNAKALKAAGFSCTELKKAEFNVCVADLATRLSPQDPASLPGSTLDCVLSSTIGDCMDRNPFTTGAG